MKAGMTVNTARKYLKLGKLASELKKPRNYRTRENSFSEVWPEIENLLTVCMAIMDSIKAHARFFKIEPYSFCNALQWTHCLPYQGGLLLLHYGTLRQSH